MKTLWTWAVVGSVVVGLGCKSEPEEKAAPTESAPVTEQSSEGAPPAGYTCERVMDSIERTRQSNPGLADAHFSDYSGTDPGIPVIPTRWLGKTQHVPHADWNCSLEWESSAQSFSVFWYDRKGGHRMGFGPLVGGNTPLPDVFAKGTDTPEGVAWTKRLFKTPPTLHSLLQLAFSRDANGFQCTSETRDEGIRFAIALIVAETGLALAEHVQAYKATLPGYQRIITGKNRGETWRAIVDSEQNGTVWRLEASSPSKKFIDSVVHFSQNKASVPKLISDAPVRPQCANFMALASKPSIEKARRMLEDPAVAENKVVKQALQEYLKANKQ